jgi:hypothetical protein
MLTGTEKAFLEALTALKQKNYSEAIERFETAAPEYGTNSEFNLLYQSTRLLLEVKRELKAIAQISLNEKELIING